MYYISLSTNKNSWYNLIDDPDVSGIEQILCYMQKYVYRCYQIKKSMPESEQFGRNKSEDVKLSAPR